MRRFLWALPLFLLAAGCRPNAVWSPDGKQLVLEPHGKLFTFRTDTHQFRQLTKGPKFSLAPVWSPDASRLVYYDLTQKGKDTTGIDLMTLDLQSGVAKPLVGQLPLLKPEGNGFDLGAPAELLHETLGAAFRPDGSEIAYTAFEGSDATLWTVNADGSGAKSLLTERKSAYNAVWSPDGSKIAFISVTPPDPNAPPPAQNEKEIPIQSTTGKGNLEVVNADGSGRKVLWDAKTRESLTPFGPAPLWSADGKTLYVTVDQQQGPKPTNIPEKCELFAVPAEGGEPKSVTQIGGPSPFMTLNPAGAAFFFAPATQNEKYPRVGFAAAPYTTITKIGTLDAATLGTAPGKDVDTDSFPIPSISPDGARMAVSFVPKVGKPVLLLRGTTAAAKWDRYVVPLGTATPPAKPAAKAGAKKRAAKRR